MSMQSMRVYANIYGIALYSIWPFIRRYFQMRSRCKELLARRQDLRWENDEESYQQEWRRGLHGVEVYSAKRAQCMQQASDWAIVVLRLRQTGLANQRIEDDEAKYT